MEIFVVRTSWNISGDTGNDILGLFQTEENAIKRLKEDRDEVLNDKLFNWTDVSDKDNPKYCYADGDDCYSEWWIERYKLEP